MASNNAPRVKWFRTVMACDTIRHRLYLNGNETAFFIDDAKAAGKGRWTQGDPVGLFASGSGNQIRRDDGSAYRVAALMGSFRNVGMAKARAEQMAFL